jgi:hypothetical protein
MRTRVIQLVAILIERIGVDVGIAVGAEAVTEMSGDLLAEIVLNDLHEVRAQKANLVLKGPLPSSNRAISRNKNLALRVLHVGIVLRMRQKGRVHLKGQERLEAHEEQAN